MKNDDTKFTEEKQPSSDMSDALGPLTLSQDFNIYISSGHTFASSTQNTKYKSEKNNGLRRNGV